MIIKPTQSPWSPGLKPIKHTSSLLVVATGLLMLSSLYDILNLAFLPSFKRIEYCLLHLLYPKECRRRWLRHVSLLKYQVVFWIPFALGA